MRRWWLILGGVALIAAVGVALRYVLPRFTDDELEPSGELYPLRGVDVSAHNGDIDFEKLGEIDPPLDFAYLKATEGTDFVDKKFRQNLRGFRKLGIPVGAYHFFRFDTDGEMQALNFLAALKGKKMELPPAIDIEKWGNPDGHATAKIVDRLRDMISYMEAEGYQPIIYTNYDGYWRFIYGNFDNYPLWLCIFQEPNPEGFHPAVWQYSHRGSVEGIDGNVDLDAAPRELLIKVKKR